MTLETEQFLLGATDLDCFGRATPGLSPTAPEALPAKQAASQRHTSASMCTDLSWCT